MAIKYLKSGATGAADGSTWADAYTTLVAALAGMAAGDICYVSNNHSESTAGAATFTSPGTALLPCRLICVNDSAEPPTTRATTAVIATTGTNAHMGFAGFAYVYGIKFSAGTSAFTAMNFTAPSPWGWIFEDGYLQLNSTSGVMTVGLSSNQTEDNQRLVLINTPLICGGIANKILCRTRMIWQNTPNAVQTNAPTVLMMSTIIPAQFLGVGLDLSALGAGKAIVDVASTCPSKFTFEGCKLNSLVSKTTGNILSAGSAEVQFNNCDSNGTNYQFYKEVYQGVAQSETGITRVDGASDGSTSFSLKMISSSGSSIFYPLVSPNFQFWNETTGSPITVTIPVLTDNITLTDSGAWLQVNYLGSTDSPIYSGVSDRMADNIFGTPVNQTSDTTSSWNNTGSFTNPIRQSLAVTLTPQMKGLVNIEACLARASTTIYVDPQIVVT